MTTDETKPRFEPLPLDDEAREAETAAALLHLDGACELDPYAVPGFAHAFIGVPDGLFPDNVPDGVGHADCVTVLANTFGGLTPPDGWFVSGQYAAGERECPWCDGSGHVGTDTSIPGWPERVTAADPAAPMDGLPECPLCEGDRVLYMGEETSLVILCPRYAVVRVDVGRGDCAIDSLHSDLAAACMASQQSDETAASCEGYTVVDIGTNK